MYRKQLMPLLVKGTFTPGSVTTIATLCDDWFQDEASLVSFVFRSVFFDLRARDWDQQGVPTSEFDSFAKRPEGARVSISDRIYAAF